MLAISLGGALVVADVGGWQAQVLGRVPLQNRVQACRLIAGRGNPGAFGNLSPDLAEPVALELAKAVEHLPGEQSMPGGGRYELKWDGFILWTIRKVAAAFRSGQG